MFSTPRFFAIFFSALALLWPFSIAAFNYPPVARLFSLDLAGRNLARAKLSGRRLTQARLGGADLTSAELAGADLTSADLRRAVLASADLRGASLAGADLTGADLKGADLKGADLGEALGLTSQQLEPAQIDELTSLPRDLRPYFQRGRTLEIERAEAGVSLDFVPHKVALSEDGSLLAVVGEWNEVMLWRVSDGPAVEQLPAMTGLRGDGRSVCFGPGDAPLVAAGSDGGEICLWRVGERSPFRVLERGKYEGYVFNIKFDAGGRRLVSVSNNETSQEKTAHVWGVEEGGAETSLPIGSAEQIVDVNAQQMLMLTVTKSEATDSKAWVGRIHALAGGTAPSLLTRGEGSVSAGAFSRDGQLMAVGSRRERPDGSAGGSLSVMGARSGNPSWLSDPEFERTYPTSIDFSPDGRMLASGTADGVITIWRTRDGQPLIMFNAHARGVLNLSFGADWRTLASAGEDRTVKLWRFDVK